MIVDNHKLQRIKILQDMITSRWLMHAGIVVLGLIQKVIGVAQFNYQVFLLIFVSYAYNSAFYFYLRRNPKKLSDVSLHIVSILQIILDQLLITVMLYATGGIESLSFLFYFVSIFMAIVLLTEFEIILFTLFTIALYIAVVSLEYQNIIPHIWRYGFDPRFYQNFNVTLHNTSTVVSIFIFTALFSAFIHKVIRTREQEVLLERDKMISLINSLIDGIILFDPKGEVVLMNPYANKILFNNKKSFRGLLQLHYFERELHPFIQYINQATTKRKVQIQEMIISQPRGRIVMQTTVLPLRDVNQRLFGSLVVMHDMTSERDLDEMKSDFISVAAHQLRTPLSTLKWLFKLLLDEDGGPLNDKQNDLLQKGSTRNDEAIEIVNNLLDISEIESGEFMYQFIPKSLTEIVQAAVDSCQIIAQRKNVKLQYTASARLPLVAVDSKKVKLAVQNLVENAIKYSRADMKVTITLKASKNKVILAIHDTGIGMSAETQAKIFVKFYRGKEASNLEPTGSGLGLYIVHNIIEKHGGTINFTSTLGKGSIFTLHFPIAKK